MASGLTCEIQKRNSMSERKEERKLFSTYQKVRKASKARLKLKFKDARSSGKSCLIEKST